MTFEAITGRTVRDALRQFSRDRSTGMTPLVDLETIGRSLSTAGFRVTDATRRFELARVLGEIAETELLRLRAIVIGVEAAVLADPADPVETMDRLVEDFAHDRADLEGASAVYHLYIRTDLGLGLPDLADFLGDRHRRTLQRRLQRGVLMITTRLLELERTARIEARVERLARRLPSAAAPLLGRHALLSRLGERVGPAVEGPSITALRGEAGVGKSALAAAFAHRALDRGWVDDIAWVDASRTEGGALDAASILRDAVGQLDAGGTVGDHDGPRAACFGDRRALVVIDGLDEPAVAQAVARGLAGIGGPRFALLAGRVGWADTPVPRVIDVPPLGRADALTLLRHELARRGLAGASNAADDALGPIIGAVGGHPGAIRHAAAMLRASSIAAVARDLEEGVGEAADYIGPLWRRAWAEAPPDTRSVVRASIGSDGGFLDEPDGSRTGERFDAALRDAVDRGMLIRYGGARPRFQAACFLARFVCMAERTAERSEIGDSDAGEPIVIAAPDFTVGRARGSHAPASIDAALSVRNAASAR